MSPIMTHRNRVMFGFDVRQRVGQAIPFGMRQPSRVDRNPPGVERRAMSGETKGSRGNRGWDEVNGFRAEVVPAPGGAGRVRVCKVQHRSHVGSPPASFAERSRSDASSYLCLRLRPILRHPPPTISPPYSHVSTPKCFRFSPLPLSAFNISGLPRSSGSSVVMAAPYQNLANKSRATITFASIGLAERRAMFPDRLLPGSIVQNP